MVLGRQIHFLSCLNCAMNYTDEVCQLKNIVQLCVKLLSERHHLKQFMSPTWSSPQHRKCIKKVKISLVSFLVYDTGPTKVFYVFLFLGDGGGGGKGQ